jgi:hypothetical protein
MRLSIDRVHVHGLSERYVSTVYAVEEYSPLALEERQVLTARTCKMQFTALMLPAHRHALGIYIKRSPAAKGALVFMALAVYLSHDMVSRTLVYKII